MASITILKGATSGQRLPLTDDRTVIGRSKDCHIVVDLPAVSREHAYILRVDGKFYLEDRGSRNGTFINNQQITQRTPLKDNDRIKICDFLCTFHEQAPRPPLPDDLLPDDTGGEESGSSTVEAKIERRSSHMILAAQPAEKLKALLDITVNLSKTLELDSLLPKIADSLFQLFRQADRCFLILRDESSGRLHPKLIQARRAGGEASARFSKSIVGQCIETGQALLSEDASTDSRFGMAQSITDFRIRSVMCAPLVYSDGRAVGVIQLDTQDRGKKFVEDDLKLLVGVANQAGIALENVRMHDSLLKRERAERDLEIAREVQRGFLPQQLPEIPGYQFFSHYESAQEIGGDYYDFIPLNGGRLAILLGDVAGKGVPAALLMAKISAEGRFCMLTEPDPAAAITRLNELLVRGELHDRFVTLAACVLDPAVHVVTLINAGHVPPLVYRGETRVLEEVGASGDFVGFPLGVFGGHAYASMTLSLKPGDCMFVFTDGVTDAMNVQNEAFQMEGIRRALLSGEPGTPAQMGERLVRAVKQYSAGRSQHDDIALVCFGRLAGEG